MTLYSLQSVPLVGDQTLEGSRTSIYVLLKMLKSFTSSTIKSYQIKFAMEMSLLGSASTLGFCTAIRSVIDHWTIRHKFSSVHPDLRRQGIVKVQVGEEGLEFIRENDLDFATETTQKKVEAVKQKTKGNAAYSKKDFDAAIHHYEMALELDMEEIVYWSNLSAVCFQTEAFEEVFYFSTQLTDRLMLMLI